MIRRARQLHSVPSGLTRDLLPGRSASPFEFCFRPTRPPRRSRRRFLPLGRRAKRRSASGPRKRPLHALAALPLTQHAIIDPLGAHLELASACAPAARWPPRITSFASSAQHPSASLRDSAVSPIRRMRARSRSGTAGEGRSNFRPTAVRLAETYGVCPTGCSDPSHAVRCPRKDLAHPPNARAHCASHPARRFISWRGTCRAPQFHPRHTARRRARRVPTRARAA